MTDEPRIPAAESAFPMVVSAVNSSPDRDVRWEIDGEVVGHGERFTVPDEAAGRRLRGWAVPR